MRMHSLISIGAAAALMQIAEEGQPGAGSAAPGTGVVAFTASIPALKAFDENSPAEFGNSLLQSLLQSTAFDEDLQQAIDTNEQVKKYIHFEITKALMSASEKGKEINLYAIFEGGKNVERLNNRLLQYFGIITREIVDDEVETKWTSDEMEKAYNYSGIDKQKDEAEYQRRFNNRKRLNLRLSEASKVAVALIDRQVKADQLQLVENADTKQVEPVINNAPADLRGDTTKNPSTTVKFGQRTPQEGAKIAPNVAALVKVASEAHKKADADATGTGERSDKGNDRSGDAKLGMSDEDFGAIVNNLRRAIGAQEGKLTAEMQKQLVALVPYIDEQIKLTLSQPQGQDEAALDKPMTEEERSGAPVEQAAIAQKSGKKGK